MKVKWKQMPVRALRERRNREMESLTSHQSQKESEERQRDSLLSKAMWLHVSHSVETSAENFFRHKIALNLLCWYQRVCLGRLFLVFPIAAAPRS